MLSRDELATLIRAHQAELYRYARYLGADPAAAEDLVQDTFLAALRSRRTPAAQGLVSAAWLRGITKNLFLQSCRRNRKDPVRVDSQMVERAEDTWVSAFLRGGDGFDYLEALRKCYEDLPARQRAALDDRYVRKTPRAEMARSASMTEDGIKALLRRIRTALAECVRRRLGLQEAHADERA